MYWGEVEKPHPGLFILAQIGVSAMLSEGKCGEMLTCALTMLDRSSILFNMNVLTTDKRTAVIKALVEGNSIRATVRMTGVAKNTVTKLLVELGTACEKFHDKHVRGVGSKRIQADEIWSFCYAKDKNLPDSMRGQPGVGSVWTWTALCADSKLIVAYHVGTRDGDCAMHFMEDVASRLANRVQLTTDGHRVYLNAVDAAFGTRIDYAMLIKQYGEAADEHRYSPGVCISAKPAPIVGNPDRAHVSTSFVERQNLTMRMSMRRFTRLTNGFSKKVRNLECAVALHFMYYNFCRVHQTLRVTPAMEAGLANQVWDAADLLKLLDWAKESN